MRQPGRMTLVACAAAALTLAAWTTSAHGRGLRAPRTTQRVVRANSHGGTDTYTRWRAKGTTFLHVSSTTPGKPTEHQRFSLKAGSVGTIHLKSWSGMRTTRAKSWRMANGVVTEHKRTLSGPGGPRVTERTTFGKRTSTGSWKDSTGGTGRSRRWNLNERQMVVHVSSPGPGGSRSHLRVITNGRAGQAHIRSLYERANAMFK